MSRILGLDILRCIAILLVILMHSSHFLTPIFSFPYLGILIRRFAGIMNFLGELGVELFFILSGFLIGGILIKTFEKTNFDFKEIKNFWVRRWFRTLPNYLLFLLLNIVFFVFILKENSFYPQYFFFLQNFTDKIYPFFKESWSLAIEEWFYLSLPIILFFVRKLLNKRSIKKQLLISFIIYFLVFFLLKVYAVFIIDVPETRGIVIYRLDTMVIGVFMSYFYKYYEKSFINNKMKLFLFGILIFFVLFCLLVASAFPNFNLNTNYWYDKFHKILMLDLFGISFAMLIPLAISIQTTKFKTFNYIVTTISVISYSLYLIHFSILDVLIFSRLNNTTPISSLIIYISYFVVVFVSSYIVYKYFEIPITKMREKVSNKE